MGTALARTKTHMATNNADLLLATTPNTWRKVAPRDLAHGCTEEAQQEQSNKHVCHVFMY